MLIILLFEKTMVLIIVFLFDLFKFVLSYRTCFFLFHLVKEPDLSLLFETFPCMATVLKIEHV